jgi:hypothetical protein
MKKPRRFYDRRGLAACRLGIKTWRYRLSRSLGTITGAASLTAVFGMELRLVRRCTDALQAWAASVGQCKQPNSLLSSVDAAAIAAINQADAR